eukprot:12710580-Alexandrium_andersonii.AAC.1
MPPTRASRVELRGHLRPGAPGAGPQPIGQPSSLATSGTPDWRRCARAEGDYLKTGCRQLVHGSG